MEELLGVITGLAVIGKLSIGMTKALIILVLINSVIGFFTVIGLIFYIIFGRRKKAKDPYKEWIKTGKM